MKNNDDILDLSTVAWRERVYIETSEHVICGYVFMPKSGNKARLLSEILNNGKSFIAVKDCTLEYKLNPHRPVESHEFMQINSLSIILMRPLKND